MMFLRLLNIQGIAGIAVSLALAVLLVVQKGETRHWRKQSAAFEQRYSQNQAAFAQTVANYRAAADQARVADEVNVGRVSAEQRQINQRSSNDYETRLAAARVHAQCLCIGAEAPADPGVGGDAPMPGLSVPPDRVAKAPREDRLPPSDQLIATEQSIQLDELIKWVRRQAAVDPYINAVQPKARASGQ